MNLKDHVNFFENKKVLVTGGTGLIGRFVVNKLCELNADVTVVSLDELKLNNKAIYIKGDLTDFEFCKKISKNIDFAFHISGVKGSVKVTIEKPSSFFVPLIMMNTNFLEACRLNKVKRLVYTSSIGAYSSREIFIEDEEDNSKPPMDMYRVGPKEWRKCKSSLTKNNII